MCIHMVSMCLAMGRFLFPSPLVYRTRRLYRKNNVYHAYESNAILFLNRMDV